jgi:hypothetical protein
VLYESLLLAKLKLAIASPIKTIIQTASIERFAPVSAKLFGAAAADSLGVSCGANAS